MKIRGGTPIYGDTGMCRSTESVTGSTNQRLCLEQGILFAIPTLEHGRGYSFAARIALQMNVAAVPTRAPLHVYSNTPFLIQRSTFQSGTGYLVSPFCLEQGGKGLSL